MGGFVNRLESAFSDFKRVAGIAVLGAVAAFSPVSEAQSKPNLEMCLAQDKKQAVNKDIPDENTQRYMEEQIRKTFSEDYKKKDPASRIALSDKLFKSAEDPKNDVKLSFCLYREAVRAAADGLDLQKAFAISEKIAESYNTRGLSFKCEAFNIARKLVNNAEQASTIGENGLVLTEALFLAGDYTSAIKIASDVKQLPKLPKELVQRSTDLNAEIKQVQTAELSASADPNDAKSHNILARYTGFRLGKWEEAKEIMRKGNDENLKTLINLENMKPQTPDVQYAVAQKYFELAKTLKGNEKEQYEQRVIYWCNTALPNANALMKADIEKMLKEVQTAGVKGNLVDLMKMIDPAKDAADGNWKFAGQSLVSPNTKYARLQIPYIPPEEYDLKIVVQKKEGNSVLCIGLVGGGRQFTYGIDGWDPPVAGIDFIDGKGSNANESTYKGKIFSDDKPKMIVCSVRKNGVTVSADGKMLTEWKGIYQRLTLSQDWAVPNKKALFIGEYGTVYQIDQITLTPISGQGQKLR